jgi:hypothetical protein
MTDKPRASAKRTAAATTDTTAADSLSAAANKRPKVDDDVDTILIDTEPLLDEREIESDQASISTLLATAITAARDNTDLLPDSLTGNDDGIPNDDGIATTAPAHRKRNRRRKRGRGKNTTTTAPAITATVEETSNREIDVDEAERIDPAAFRQRAAGSRRPHTVHVSKPQRPLQLVYLYGNCDRSVTRRAVRRCQGFFRHEASVDTPVLAPARVQEIKEGLRATGTNGLDPRLALLRPGRGTLRNTLHTLRNAVDQRLLSMSLCVCDVLKLAQTCLFATCSNVL